MDFSDERWNQIIKASQKQYLMEQQTKERVRAAVPKMPNLAPMQNVRVPTSSHTLGQNPAVQLSPELNKFLGQFRSTLQGFGNAISSIISTLDQPRKQVSDVLTNVSNLVNRLPDFTPAIEHLIKEAERQREELMAGRAVLTEADYGFADELWDRVFTASFAHVPNQTRDAVATNMLLSETRTDDFGVELEAYIMASRGMQRRWSVVEDALEAHIDRKYTLSIPALLPQIEAALKQTLKLTDRAVIMNGAHYLPGPDGKLKYSNSGKPQNLIMLNNGAVEATKIKDSSMLESATEYMLTSMITQRNSVLHGDTADYGKAKLSIQCLLMLMLVAGAVAELEELQ